MAKSSFLSPTISLAAAKLHEGMKIADFNAGSGFFTRAAARAVGGKGGVDGVVWAVDINRELLPRIKNLSIAEGLHNVEVLCGDIERQGGSSLPSDFFDAVIIANALFSATDKEGVAEEAWRVLKKGGHAIVIDWQDSFGGLGPHPDHLVEASVAQHLFESRGFAPALDIPAGAYHWGLMFRKKAR